MRSERSRTGSLAARAALAVLGAALLAAPGCAVQRTVLPDSAVDTHAGPDADLDFWDDVAARPVVTNHDALHGLLLIAGEPPAAGAGYEPVVEAARRRGWITGDTPAANESATMGTISVAVCDILDVDGGVLMHLLGPSPRYCTKELVFMEIIPWRTEHQALTGLEFVDLAGRVEDALGASP